MKDMIFIDTYKKIQKHDHHHVTIPDYVYIEIFLYIMCLQKCSIQFDIDNIYCTTFYLSKISLERFMKKNDNKPSNNLVASVWYK